jgi:hypothetical protein
MTYDEIYEKVEALHEAIVSSTTPVEPQEIGLDSRCGPILCGSDFVASLMPGQLDYYGGFEYVKEGVITIGEMKIYLAEGNDRVQRVLDFVTKE